MVAAGARNKPGGTENEGRGSMTRAGAFRSSLATGIVLLPYRERGIVRCSTEGI